MKCKPIDCEWRKIQDDLVRHVLGQMGYRRWTDGDLCKASGVSSSIWDNVKNLRYPMKIETMVSVTMAVGLRIQPAMFRREQQPSKAFTLWTL